MRVLLPNDSADLPGALELDSAYLPGAELYSAVRVTPHRWRSQRTDQRISVAENGAAHGPADFPCGTWASHHMTLKLVVDERLLKLTMPGRAYCGPLTSAAVDRARHAVAVGDAALRGLSQMVVRADNRGIAAASVDTRAFMLCLLPWVLARIDAPILAHAA